MENFVKFYIMLLLFCHISFNMNGTRPFAKKLETERLGSYSGMPIYTFRSLL